MNPLLQPFRIFADKRGGTRLIDCLDLDTEQVLWTDKYGGHHGCFAAHFLKVVDRTAYRDHTWEEYAHLLRMSDSMVALGPVFCQSVYLLGWRCGSSRSASVVEEGKRILETAPAVDLTDDQKFQFKLNMAALSTALGRP